MNSATLELFRRLADAMRGDEPADWQWIGPHMSQRMFGITEARARAYAERHGGEAKKMGECGASPDCTPEDPCAIHARMAPDS